MQPAPLVSTMSDLPPAAGRGHYFSDINATDNATIHNGDVYNYRDIGLEERRILTWLSPIGPFRVHNQALKQYQPGTLSWFFDETRFPNWRDEEEEDTVLWCWGHVGTGKTTLVAQIPSNLRTFGVAKGNIALVYCRFEERRAQKAEHLLGSILTQLYKREEVGYDVPKLVKDYYLSSPFHDPGPPMHQLEIWLRERYEARRPVFVLVDAIDELDPLVVRALLGRLQHKNVKLLVTSRNVPLIKQYFLTYREIEIRSTDEDLRSTISARLQSQSTTDFQCLILDAPARTEPLMVLHAPTRAASIMMRDEIVNRILVSSRNM